MRRRRRIPLVDIILLIMALGLLVYAAVDYYPFYHNDRKLAQLQNEVLPDDETTTETDENNDLQKNEQPDIDWKKLQSINSDIIGWIKVPGTKINYPILESNEWNEYLHEDYEGDYNYLGSIFIQPKTSSDFTDKHSIIYGHNMRNKSMFGSLHKYEDEEFYKKHKYFYIYQPGKTIKVQVYSTYDCRDTGTTYETDFNDQDEWGEWIGMTVRQSYYNAGVIPGTKDKIITLSTCSNGRGYSSRYVICDANTVIFMKKRIEELVAEMTSFEKCQYHKSELLR